MYSGDTISSSQAISRTPIGRLMEGHARLRAVFDDLETITTSPLLGSREVLAEIRWRVVREMLPHLALDDRHVLGPLSESSNPRHASTAHRFTKDLEGIYALFRRHVARWDGQAYEQDWAAYCRSVHKVIAAFRERMDREEKELYPLIADMEVAAVPGRNWAGDAWELRDTIDRNR
jgi:hypothetical protein